jgi:glycine oxidase
MAKHPDVLIIGGGVIGLTTAYYLARDGVRVQLLDRSAPGTEASWAGAGIVPPGNPAGAASPYDRLRATSSRMFPVLSAELHERTGIDNGFRVTGGIEVFSSALDTAVDLWRQEGIEFEQVDSASLVPIEPELRLGSPAAFLIRGMAQVRNPWHLRALIAACGSVGVNIVGGEAITRLRVEANRVVSAAAESGTEYPADRFLIASGAWSDRLLKPLGRELGVHPVLGQMVLFNPGRNLLQRIVCVGKQYLVPRADGRILAGSTEEPEAGFEKKTTDRSVTLLQRFALDLVPELARVRVEKTWAGLRPGSPDALPYLGAIPGFTNAFVATGHFRAGIQLSPATALLMGEVITNRPTTLSLDPFRLDRPPAPPLPSAFRS